MSSGTGKEQAKAQSQRFKNSSSTYFWRENPENLKNALNPFWRSKFFRITFPEGRSSALTPLFKQLATIMAIGSTSASKQSLQNHQKGKMSNSGKKKEDRSRKQSDDDGVNLRAKRTKRAGVRLVGGRLYDSEHGKTCHQVSSIYLTKPSRGISKHVCCFFSLRLI